jgi:predicted nucleotidyltransferase
MTSPLDDPVVREFAEAVRAKIGPHVQRIVLFGSRARGAAEEGSDYDMAVVVTHRDRDIEERVLDAAVEMLDRYDALVSAHVFTPEDWEFERLTPLGLNISKEGVLI